VGQYNQQAGLINSVFYGKDGLVWEVWDMLEGSVKIREAVWRLDERKCELTDGFRVFRYHAIGRAAMESTSRLEPLTWEKQLPNSEWEQVRDTPAVGELNRILTLLQRRTNAA